MARVFDVVALSLLLSRVRDSLFVVRFFRA